jgi:hypothetical protein
MKIRPVAAEFHAERRTDMKSIVAFRNFANAPNKRFANWNVCIFVVLLLLFINKISFFQPMTSKWVRQWEIRKSNRLASVLHHAPCLVRHLWPHTVGKQDDCDVIPPPPTHFLPCFHECPWPYNYDSLSTPVECNPSTQCLRITIRLDNVVVFIPGPQISWWF